MKSLVVGHLGQLGRFLVPLLQEAGGEVTGLGRDLREEPDYPSFEEVYLLHITRPTWEIDLPFALQRGFMEVVKYIHLCPEARILVPDSHAALKGFGPKNWVKDKSLTRALVAQHCDRVVMPTLSQFISEWGDPKTMYLMELLHQIARGEEPTPARPSDWIQPDHAKNGALSLMEGLRGNWSAVPASKPIRVSEFIEMAKDPHSWVGEIVEKLRP
jgi:hypothetical protein